MDVHFFIMQTLNNRISHLSWDEFFDAWHWKTKLIKEEVEEMNKAFFCHGMCVLSVCGYGVEKHNIYFTLPFLFWEWRDFLIQCLWYHFFEGGRRK